MDRPADSVAPVTSSAPLEPVAPSERIATLDVLRGIALLGVLVANIWLWFSGIVFRFPAYAAELQTPSLDSAAFLFVAVFIAGKALSTFSFLFGLGFAVQMMRARERGQTVSRVYARRLAILLLIGAAHGVLLWYGDILLTYAVLGFGLLLFRDTTPRRLLMWAAVFAVVVPLVGGSVPIVRGALGGAAPADAAAAAAAEAAFNQEMLESLGSGDPVQIVQANLAMLPRMLFGPTFFNTFSWFGLFLLGLYAGRRRIFEAPEAFRRGLRLVAIWGFTIGLSFSLLETVLRMMGPAFTTGRPWAPLALSATSIFNTIPFALAYIALATLLLQRDRVRRLLMPFAPVGRMALTNYLTQTVVCMAIYYGGGLVGTAGPALGITIALAIFAAQMMASRWWLERYRFGPMEWVWRSATYGRAQPMRLVRPAQPVVA